MQHIQSHSRSISQPVCSSAHKDSAVLRAIWLQAYACMESNTSALNTPLWEMLRQVWQKKVQAGLRDIESHEEKEEKRERHEWSAYQSGKRRHAWQSWSQFLHPSSGGALNEAKTLLSYIVIPSHKSVLSHMPCADKATKHTLIHARNEERVSSQLHLWVASLSLSVFSVFHSSD